MGGVGHLRTLHKNTVLGEEKRAEKCEDLLLL